MNRIWICLMVWMFGMTAVSFAGQAPASHPATQTETIVETPAPAEQMSKKDMKAQKKALRKAARKAFWQSLKQKDGAEMLLIIIVTIFIPFLGVLLYDEYLSNRVLISLLLTFLFFIPGLIYSLLVVTGAI
ncbi:YqaE/Pmp3 family membrane protein [Pontibacter sp. G13]|uniref:YqaE/Pmp3 family membrane protein n=1 Tax=Pontibacter sp. G13 TaxID=3074898 RepID=UPI00288AA893|nr:YqaE/Pmp3 family membrane protein [Pontibacter sp. G13]WNJ21097.1 YqaE/Pmp3 family membrane protein [Pontibacter sp. G13]